VFGFFLLIVDLLLQLLAALCGFHTHAIVSRLSLPSQSTRAPLIPDEVKRLAAACETHLERRMVWNPPRPAKKNVALGGLFW